MTAADVLSGSAWFAALPGDCTAGMRTLPDGCVHCCVTSPPYYALRDYGCEGQIGLEETPEAYVAKLVAVFRELRRILHPSGCLWLNLGDSFANDTKWGGSSGGKHAKELHGNTSIGRGKRTTGLKAKDLIGIPWMVAFALRADGWYLRQWCPWVKRNPMPESVTDRPGTACETVFLLTKESDYFFDMEAVKRAASEATGGWQSRARQGVIGHGNSEEVQGASTKTPDGSRNFRSSDLWFDSVGVLLTDDDAGTLLGFDVTLKAYKGAHFAVMPKKLVEPCVLAGTSARGVCPKCGAPWTRVVKKSRKAPRPGDNSKVRGYPPVGGYDVPPGQTANTRARKASQEVGNRDPQRHCTTTETVGWEPGCTCDAGEPRPAVVFDPFAGSGTVLSVAVDHGRKALGCELSGEYAALIQARMRNTTPALFGE